ncbi:2Fe-2S iron-sulfur cluster binding domain-containing protein [Rhodoblastus acidophilus]|uniref:2Fe-2S iron-sulfur cluster binding domain-containing protein n=1 Tax=Candidatus Rhodoblastus alkanivorans TaxID=2954117 RepID=A0ABS9ZB90_9HYPH|nr:2Fe-2S iron-sulfur cluster binding domain-containing protein [Candidatus Rhodoblastus alkanivorans]MCI4679123.1 2Fe-2S iron-sulfur cluster binding domain-containing protein [Candidatus Rhodoblastus alkanivorans]MCI4684988.1 2Fe-2S iron-sulfur cluster binding domain-containing protein [Candidatus Rhodoblastus alkanivorans]MDI4643102.1 2Fe-2S iron-sulfur cluster binding domain-containing protein [Rhodoblastus acidophilus]
MDPMHSITANFEDGASLCFECGAQEDILSAAMRQNVRLICQCRKAYCGSCKALCVEGDYEFGDRINIQVLPSDEEEKGIVVTCDTFPRSDLVLNFSYASDRLGEAVVGSLSGRVQSVRLLSDTVYQLVLQALDEVTGTPVRVDFVPGQYVEIAIPDTQEARAFSVANLPNEDGVLEFLIRKVPGGRFASYLEKSAAPGQAVNMRGPLGEFTFKMNGQTMVEDFHLHESGRVQAFVGGSTGLAPLVSMLRELHRKGYPGESHLFFGMQDSATMFYETELRELAASMPNLTLHLAMMDPPLGWSGYVGHSVGAFETHFAGVNEQPEVYLCGPAPMVAAAQASCARLGIPGELIHLEEFVASGG